ncbi:MAG: DUF3137 domain-containing protein [Candidatus Thermoplasmatota archaeon]|nr:DUF3137 domain-containing protein [Candidatus Thermoplasmatota archaeon]MDP7265681.1 DUF3137 domain-containing protein [Candidatus Thermoplasmatota archaeon]
MGLLRQLFGPSQDEVWGKLSSEMGGEFIDGGFWKGDKVIARVKDWIVTMDTYTVSTGKSSTTYTRIRAPYVNKDNFRFTIYRENVFGKIGKLFGMQDIQVGYPEFDKRYIIKGNIDYKVQMLFANPRIRELILFQPNIHFQIKDDDGWFGTSFPEGVDELYFQVVGVIKDIERLRSLFLLFSETLNHLCHLGSAYENSSSLSLLPRVQ